MVPLQIEEVLVARHNVLRFNGERARDDDRERTCLIGSLDQPNHSLTCKSLDLIGRY
jgi:hypothetical protein